jgi:tetratricopeptide (TPR) repeat protein
MLSAKSQLRTDHRQPGLWFPAHQRIPGGVLAALIALGLHLASCLAADGLSAAFDQANQLYERGQHAEAAAAYAKLLQGGKASPALYFNLGNAQFRAGQIGQAMVSYLQAERLAPRDPDIQANLRFARTLVSGGPPPPPPLWRRILPRWTLNQWTVLASVGFSLGLGLLTILQFWPGWKVWLQRGAALAGLGFGFAGAGLLVTWQDQCLTVRAVVVRPDTILRHGPLDESPSLQTLRDGQELEVVDQKDRWLQVAGASRGAGWLKQDQVVVLRP